MLGGQPANLFQQSLAQVFAAFVPLQHLLPWQEQTPAIVPVQGPEGLGHETLVILTVRHKTQFVTRVFTYEEGFPL